MASVGYHGRLFALDLLQRRLGLGRRRAPPRVGSWGRGSTLAEDAPPPDCSKRRYHASCEYGNCTALSNTTAHVVSILVEVSSSLKNGKKEWTIFGISVEEFVGELLGVFVVSAALAVAFVWWRRIGYAAFMPTVYHYTSIPQDPAWVQKTVD